MARQPSGTLLGFRSIPGSGLISFKPAVPIIEEWRGCVIRTNLPKEMYTSVPYTGGFEFRTDGTFEHRIGIAYFSSISTLASGMIDIIDYRNLKELLNSDGRLYPDTSLLPETTITPTISRAIPTWQGGKITIVIPDELVFTETDDGELVNTRIYGVLYIDVNNELTEDDY